MLEVLEINRLSELEALCPEWEDLLERSRNATIFQTPEWLFNYIRFYKHGRPFILTVRDHGKLVALALLEIVSMYGVPFKRLQFMGTGATDYLDFILDQASEESALEALFNHLAQISSRWEIIDLQQIPQNSPSLPAWQRFQAPAGIEQNQLEQEDCPILPLPSSWDGFLAGLGKKTRWNIGYYERIARRDFEYQIGPLSAEEIQEGMTALFTLHAARWRRRRLPGVLTGVKRQKFHRAVAAAFMKKGWLRLYALRLNGEIQAILYCFSYRGKGYYYLGGFEPALSKYSLGTVLTAYAIRDSIESGLTEFDFLRGKEPYKARWTRESRMNYRILLRKKALRSRMAERIIHGEIRIEHSFKEAMYKRFGGG